MNIGLIALYIIFFFIIIYFAFSNLKDVIHYKRLLYICKKNPNIKYHINEIILKYKNIEKEKERLKYIEASIDSTMKRIHYLPREERNGQRAILRTLQYQYKQHMITLEKESGELSRYKTAVEGSLKQYFPKYKIDYTYLFTVCDKDESI